MIMCTVVLAVLTTVCACVTTHGDKVLYIATMSTALSIVVLLQQALYYTHNT